MYGLLSQNYLNETDMEQLNRIITMYLDYAEDQVKRHRHIFMMTGVKNSMHSCNSMSGIFWKMLRYGRLRKKQKIIKSDNSREMVVSMFEAIKISEFLHRKSSKGEMLRIRYTLTRNRPLP